MMLSLAELETSFPISLQFPASVLLSVNLTIPLSSQVQSAIAIGFSSITSWS